MKNPIVSAAAVPVALAAALMLAAAVQAQTQVEKPADPPKAPVKAPEFTEMEKGAIDVMSLIAQRNDALDKLGKCQTELTPLQAQVRDGQLRQAIERFRQTVRTAHPGYDWDLDKNVLVPLPAKPPAPK